MGLAYDYLGHTRSLIEETRTWLNVNNQDFYQLNTYLNLYQLLHNYHEANFQYSANFITRLEETDSDLFELFNALFEDWRDVGNEIMDMFRLLEVRLNIPLDISTIPPQWFESFAESLYMSDLSDVSDTNNFSDSADMADSPDSANMEDNQDNEMHENNEDSEMHEDMEDTDMYGN